MRASRRLPLSGRREDPRSQPEGSRPIRVRIVDPDHPHYQEHGEFTGEIVSLFGKPMAKVRLENCKHGTDACFVSKGQVSEEKPWR